MGAEYRRHAAAPIFAGVSCTKLNQQNPKRSGAHGGRYVKGSLPVRRPTRIVNRGGCKTRLWQAEPSGRIAKRSPDTQQDPVRRNHDGKYRIAERGGIGIDAERMQRSKNRDGFKARPAA